LTNSKNFTSNDTAKEAQFINAKNLKTQKEEDLRKITSEMEKMQKELSQIYGDVARMSQKIREVSLLPYNDAYLDYLECEIKNVEGAAMDSKAKASKKFDLNKTKDD